MTELAPTMVAFTLLLFSSQKAESRRSGVAEGKDGKQRCSFLVNRQQYTGMYMSPPCRAHACCHPSLPCDLSKGLHQLECCRMASVQLDSDVQDGLNTILVIGGEGAQCGIAVYAMY